MENIKFAEFWVFGGMGGGFGGPHFLGSVEGKSADDKEVQEDAWQLVVDEYESYAGLHGILSWDEVKTDLEESADPGDEITDDDVDDAYNEAISGWVSYWVIPAVEGEDPEDEKWLETAPWKQED